MAKKPATGLKAYYRLAKPGIVYGNALAAAAAFLFASGAVNLPLFAATITGLSLVMASACVFNNFLDRDIDAAMARTKTRALVAGTIPVEYAIFYATLLGLAGFGLLLAYTNFLTFGVALLGFVLYVCVYTPLKRITPHTLWVGSLAGATPPVVGYTAVTNTLDLNALWLFLFLFIWQVPHFLAIAVYRFEEYRAAGIPLFITKPPGPKARRLGRAVFYASLVVLLAWCAALMLHK